MTTLLDGGVLVESDAEAIGVTGAGGPVADWTARAGAFTVDVLFGLGVLIAAGLPRDMMFPHQIPGDILGSGESEDESRCLSSASPVWTGLLEASGNVGITRFGPINTSLITQYLPEHTNGWGIFEWHPAPNAAPESQALYDASKAALQDYYNHGAHVLFPGWWGFHGVVNTIFPLNDSRFADAIKDFLKAAPSSPWSPPSFASAQPQRPSAEENMMAKKQ